MSEQIGIAAGKIWEYLNVNGPSTTKTVRKDIALDEALVNQAIGWLAREGKVKITRDKRLTTVELTE